LLSNARHRSPGAAAFDLKAAGFDFSPAWREPDKSFPDKIRQQLQVLRDLNLLEFLGSGSYRFTLSGFDFAQCLPTATLSATMSPMTTRDFKVFLEPDADYGGYVVVCPSIPGCYSQGKTVPEALANIREAIDLCIEDMESRGEEIPDPNNVLIGSVVVTR